MESNSWSRFLSATKKRHLSSQQSRNDIFLDVEENDGGEDDLRAVFTCPFCAEDFDIVGLCCHIDDEHPVEDKNVVCPICAVKTETDLIRHITMQHGNLFKMQRRRRLRQGHAGSHSSLSLLRKELREANLQALFALSRSTAPSSAAPDPLLSSLIYTLPATASLKEMQSEFLDKRNASSLNSVEETGVESYKPLLSDKEHAERGRRSKFVQGLTLSTLFDEIL